MVANPNFKFRRRCQAQKITHLYFVNDLMVFSKVDRMSLKLIKEALDNFQDWFNIQANFFNSYIFMVGMRNDELIDLASIIGYDIGSLSIKYLRVPLITSKLRSKNCKPLINRILERIECNIHRYVQG